MTTVLAAIDTSAAATPVLATARTIGKLYHARVEAIHMDGEHAETVRALAESAGMKLRLVEGQSPTDLIAALEHDDDIVAVVVGARGLPMGPRPVGHIARAILTELRKPLVIVPPEARTRGIARVLVPLDGTHASAAALASVIKLAVAEEVEVVVLHVHHGLSVPRFCDQTQHETAAWSGEFLARNCPYAKDAKLKLRTGVPGESVMQVAVNDGADLVALSWSQDFSPDRAAVVRDVLERSSIPVLLVPIAPSP
jgi:nucleotide-binding universal stress UspA family protein